MIIRFISSIVISIILFAPMSLAQDRSLFDGRPFTIFLQGVDIAENPEIKSKEKARIDTYLRNVIEDIEQHGPITGFSSLVSRNISTIGRAFTQQSESEESELRAIRLRRLRETLGGAPECDDAFKNKLSWEISKGITISWAQIRQTGSQSNRVSRYRLHRVVESTPRNPVETKGSIWDGYFEVCTWLNEIEYYFLIEFRINRTLGTHRLTAHKHSGNPPPQNPFPNTMPFSPEMIKRIESKGFRWKLHARGRAIDIVVAKENGKYLPLTDPIFRNPEDNCIDFLFVEPPESNRLPPKGSYCLGRCDGRIVSSE